MTDPHTALAGALTGAGAGAVTVVLGAQVDALVVGLGAALFASIWLSRIDSHLKAVSAVLFSAMLAAYGSPVAAGYLSATIPAVAVDVDALRLLLAAVIGGSAPSLTPLLLAAAMKRIGEGKP